MLCTEIVDQVKSNQALLIVLGALTSLIFLFGTMLSGSKFSVDGRTVVVTGASQGMGRSLARVLSSKGANVVLVARNTGKLHEATEQARAAAKSPHSQRFLYLSADVTKSIENQKIIDEVTEWNQGNPPDIVWANAGMAYPQLLLDTAEDELKSQMDINYFAAVYLAQSTLTAWLQNSANKTSASSGKSQPLPRHFIMTSSVAAFVGLVGYTPYSPAKAALRNFHDVLQQELNLYNASKGISEPEIKVHTIFPGTILTPGLDQENETKHPALKVLEEDDTKQTADQVAEISVKELEKGRNMITTQLTAAAMKASSLNGSMRDRWLVDTIFSWLTALIWLFIAPDMAGKVRKWAKQNGRPTHS